MEHDSWLMSGSGGPEDCDNEPITCPSCGGFGCLTCDSSGMLSPQEYEAFWLNGDEGFPDEEEDGDYV